MFSDKAKIKVHFIGIGGIGMSGIAECLLSLGYKVSGSDLSSGSNTEKLKNLGAKIYIGHDESNVGDATVIVYSSAINENNPEFARAKQENIPLIRRAEMLAELMRLKYGIAIGGTHGKTTTTSFTATILHECGLDPTHIIGGVVNNLGGHAKIGQGELLVAEADESDGSFLLLNPVLSVITNIDNDHLDYYQTEENLFNAFGEFANKIPFYGCCILNEHDKNIQKIKSQIKKPYVTFGIQDKDISANYEARNIEYAKEHSAYDLFVENEFKARVKIKLPGRHNILNSLAAVAVASKLDLDFEKIAKGIEKCEGVGRRFQKVYDDGKLVVIDDYGHHPTEIVAAINAAKETRKNEIVVLFEPHRYSRTENCWKDFFHCFNEADKLHITPIYPASEEPIKGITSERLVEDINKLHPGFCHYFSDWEHIDGFIKTMVGEDKTLLVLGAGTIGKRVRESIERIG